jgi:hypothetical protein
MKEALPMSSQATFWDMPNATSLPAGDSGASPCGRPDGPTSAKCGLEAAPAPVSPRLAKDRGLMTLVTSGLLGRDSSASVTLQQSLENRLLPRLDTAGSTLFKLTWKHKTTPLGRRYLERQASALRTSGNGSTSLPSPNVSDHNASRSDNPQAYSERWMDRPDHGAQLAHTAQALASWPTPQMHDDKLRGNTEADNHSFPHDLSNSAMLASWSTPRNEDAESAGMRHSRGTADTLTAQSSLCGWRTPTAADHKNMDYANQIYLQDEAKLAGWASPAGRDWKDTPGMNETGINPDGSERTRLDMLPRQANLASWPTPDCDTSGSENTHRQEGTRLKILGAARLASWPTPQAADVSRMEMNRLKHDRQTRDPEMPGSYRHELPDVARMAGWPTPRNNENIQTNLDEIAETQSSWLGQHRGATVATMADLAAWPSPCTPNGGRSTSTETMDATGRTTNGRKHTALLEHAVKFAAWPTPAVDSFRSRSGNRIGEMGLDQIARTIPECPAGPVRLTASGRVLTGSDAEMESGGQLNPAHSRWLMGVLPAWDGFACTAMQSVSQRRKRSSARTSKASTA